MQGSQKTPAMREPSCHWLVGPLIQTPCGRSTNPCTSSGQTGLRRLAHGVERARYVDCQTRFRRAQNLGSGTLVHTHHQLSTSPAVLLSAHAQQARQSLTHPQPPRPSVFQLYTPSYSRHPRARPPGFSFPLPSGRPRTKRQDDRTRRKSPQPPTSGCIW